MTKRKYWTDEENKVLVQAIEAYPQNISKAFREVSKDLNRTEAACRVHWYKVLSPSNDPSKLKVSFMVVSPNAVYNNRKSGKGIQSKSIKCSLWTKIKRLLKL